MKKMFFYLIFTLLIAVPFSVEAASSIEFVCDKDEINPGGEVNCTLSSKVDENITYNKLDATIDVVGTESITFTGAEGFDGTITEQKLTVNSNSLVGNTTIGTLKIKFNNDTNSSRTIKLNDIKIYDSDNEVATLANIETIIKITSVSVPVTLESLSVSDCDSCELSPSFKQNVKFYMITTKSDQIRINAKGSNGSSVSGAGLKTLTKDNETFEIKVTSTSGNTATYKIKVTKESKADVTLKSLTIDKGTLTPKFSSSTTNYTAVVDSDKVVISAVKNNNEAKVTGDGEHALEYGRNDFTINVTAPDGTTKSYLITINRPDNRNANAYLKELTVNGEDIEFEKDIIEYVYIVDGDINELEIEAIPELENSTVEIEGNENFKVGKNIVTIKVTAEDGSEKTYTIRVVKEEGNATDNDIYLNELTISGYDIKFSKDKFEYTITIKDEKKLDITALAEEGYKVEITGNENLQDGSIIKIIVTDEEDNSSIYKIKIKVDGANGEKEESSEMNYIPIIMSSLLGILFIVDIALIIKKIKNKDK